MEVREKFDKAPKRESELGLSPEEKQKFEDLLQGRIEILLSSSGTGFAWEDYTSYRAFLNKFSRAQGGKNLYLVEREYWFDMKKAGPAFKQFFEKKINSAASSRGEGIYWYINLYLSLGYKDSAKFAATILEKPAILDNVDGSNLHQILELLRRSKDPSLAPAIVQFINNAVTEDYARKMHLDSDLRVAASALAGILGTEEAKKVLVETAENNPEFSGWLAILSKTISSWNETLSEEKPEFEEFEESVEKNRLEELRKEVENMPAEDMGEDDVYDDGYGFNYDGDYDDFDEGPILPPIPQPSSSAWEAGKLINFYGRFTPKLEKGVVLTPENYLAGLFGIISRRNAGFENVDSYLNFLFGVMEEKDLESNLPEEVNYEEAYGMAALSYARALSLASLENRPENAISEIRALQYFLGRSVDSETPDGQSIAHLALNLDKLVDFIERVRWETPLDMPESANPFLLYHPTLKRSRQIPDFRTLLAEKIRYYLAQDLANRDDKSYPDSYFEKLQEIIGHYQENLQMYKSVEEKDVPLYWEAKEKLEDFGAEKLAVFGRDGRYFFTAIKANEIGLKRKELKYVVVTRSMASQKNQSKVARYLKENGVGLEFAFIDTGYAGSIPEFAIRSLAETGGIGISSQEVDEKIMLFSSSNPTRKELSRRLRDSGPSRELDFLEGRPKSIYKPALFILDEKGKLKPESKPKSIDQQLLAWTVEHAVMRNFSPKLDPEQRIRINSQNPLEGLKFIQEFRGNYIGTHRLQLWEDKKGKKFLLKGGPRHTVQADFVGQKFLERAGLLTPKTDLVAIERVPKLKMELLEGWKEGGLTLPEEHHQNQKIQEGLLVDALLGQYDRTAWNLMFKGDKVAFIDNGASLFSRARGGYKGFPEHFGISQLQEVLANPQFAGKPVNEAYHNLLEVREGRVIVKNQILLQKMLKKLEDIDDAFIDEIITSAGFKDGEDSTRDLTERISELRAILSIGEASYRDRAKLLDAVETYSAAIKSGGEAPYLKKALSQRREDIIRLLSPLAR